jgi:hypothetical protein
VTDGSGDTSDTSDTLPTTDSDTEGSQTDTGHNGDSGSAARTCPDGMQPFGPATAPMTLCIDRYEVLVMGDLGDADQHSGIGAPTTATAESLEGVEPTTVISYGQAVAACANTPVTLDGEVREATKRMPTGQEWEDAADGTWGDGGLTFPYGDTWRDDACATPLADGEVVLADLQPTGSFPDCVSPFGVMDAVGNAWEWSDGGRLLDLAAWLAEADAQGLAVVAGAGDQLYAAAGAAPELELRMQGLYSREPLQADDGSLYLAPGDFDPGAEGIRFSGYLVIRNSGPEGAALPVWFDVPEPGAADGITDEDEPLLLLWEADGAPVPEKRGCAYYTGNELSCSLTSVSLDHLYDFQGTISFRCVAEPLSLAD